MPANSFPPEFLHRWLERYSSVLERHRDALNAINVFPVPDGDTGGNLLATAQAAHRSGVEPSEVAHAVLLAARGNSGVLFSQVVRGIADAITTHGSLDSASLADGLVAATRLAGAAVAVPVKGTILTVLERTALKSASLKTVPLDESLRQLIAVATSALEATTAQLPELERAGVVDAGALGFVLFLQAGLAEVDGTEVPDPEPVEVRAATTSVANPYEVRFLADVTPEAAEQLRLTLERFGDCVLVVGSEGTFTAHVHTDRPGQAVEACLSLVEPRELEIAWMPTGDEDFDLLEPKPAPVTEGLGLVAIGAGEGIERVYRSMGVTSVVRGTRTAPPSPAEVIEGIRRASATRILILPNDPGCWAVVRAAIAEALRQGLCETAEMLPTESPLQVFTALLSFDPDSDFERNRDFMRLSAARTQHAEVGRAPIEVITAAGPARAGQLLGISGGVVVTVSDDPEAVISNLLERHRNDETELVTILYGAGVDEWSAHQLGNRISENHDIEVEVHRGGQPDTPYLLGFE